MICNVNILSYKTPNRSDILLQSSYLFPRSRTSDLRFAAFSKAFRLCALLLSINFDFQSSKYGDFHTSSKTSFWKILKYEENKINHIFTIDKTNVLKKSSHYSDFQKGSLAD